MIGNIAAYNEEMYRERRRSLGRAPLPAAASLAAISRAIEAVGAGQEAGQYISIPYVGRTRVKGFRVALKGELFVDISGWGNEREPALTLSALLNVMAQETQKQGTLFWGLTMVGQFQGYVMAWKVKC